MRLRDLARLAAVVSLCAGCATSPTPKSGETAASVSLSSPQAGRPAPAAPSEASAPPKAAQTAPTASKGKQPAPAAQPRTLEGATSRAADRLKELEARKKTTTVEPESPEKRPDSQGLAGRYEALLGLAGTPEERKPEILLRLAELAYREEEAGLRGAYESGTGPRSQSLHFPKAIGYYRQLVDAYPSTAQALTAFYNLGYLYAEEGKTALSAWAYDQVLQRDPSTPYADEIHMRLGEAAFDGDDLPSAIPHYRAVVDRGNPEYADKALYKLGWSFYNLEDYPKAVDAFSRVLEREQPSSEDLRRETMQILARCFVEWGGVAGAADYLAHHPRGSTYGDRLYREVGDLYAAASKYDDAVKAYGAGVEAFPLSAECLPMEKGILAALVVLRDIEGATRRRESWANRYGPGSAWEKGKSASQVKDAGAMAEEGLRLSALYRHSEAQRARSGLERALELYESYFKLFSSDTADGYELSYAYAQALKEAGRFSDAEKRYRAVAEDGKHSSHREEASYRRIDVLQSMRQSNPALLEELLAAHERYGALNPTSALVPQVLFAEAEILFDGSDFERARGVFARVSQLEGTDPLRVEALERVARCSFRAGRFADAEAEARKALAAPLVPDTAERARKLVEFSIFKQGEAEEGAGDRAGANRHFFRVAEEFPQEEVAQVALARAAENLRVEGKLEEAAGVHQRLAKAYRGTPYAKQSLAASAELLSSLGHWKRAADVLEDLAMMDSDAAVSAGALFRAGLALENAKDWVNAGRVFGEFAARFRENPRRAQAQFRAGEALRAQARTEDAKVRYQEAWDGKATGDEEIYRARAALALGDLALDAFRKTEIKGDLEEALSRKEELQEEALARLADAASLPYAETLTAALYRAGRVFEEMKEALLSSERPAELTPEEREQYDFLLEEKAGPLEERAIEYYQKGTASARRNRVHTEWVDRMYTRLEALVPWAYQRREELAGVWILPPLASEEDTRERRP